MLMDKDLLVDGKTYISAIRASKKIGYASDYIGQLCRGGKIPGKLIGRSWYVDFDALSTHKRENKVRKNKAILKNVPQLKKPQEVKLVREKVFENYFAGVEKHFENKFEPISIKAPSIASLSYKTEYVSRLPEVKKVPQAEVMTDVGRSRNSLVMVGLVMFMLLSVYAAGYIRYVATSSGQSQVSLGASGFLSGIFARIFGTDLKSNVPSPQNGTQFGIVAVPENGNDHATIVARVKRAFSDEVEVIVDPEGDAGVIRPVFRDGDDTEDYAFVMVPIKEQ